MFYISRMSLFGGRVACKVQSVTAPNMHHSILSIHHFVRTYTHNMKSTSSIKMFYISKMSLFGGRAACKVHSVNDGSKHTLQSLSNTSFCAYSVLTRITQKLQVVHGHSTHWPTDLLSEMSIFWVRAACEIPLVCYGSKHPMQPLFNASFVHTLKHNFKTTGHNGRCAYKMTALLWMTFPMWIRLAWGIWLESYSPWHTSQSFSVTLSCVYTASPYISLFGPTH